MFRGGETEETLGDGLLTFPSLCKNRRMHGGSPRWVSTELSSSSLRPTLVPEDLSLPNLLGSCGIAYRSPKPSTHQPLVLTASSARHSRSSGKSLDTGSGPTIGPVRYFTSSDQVQQAWATEHDDGNHSTGFLHLEQRIKQLEKRLEGSSTPVCRSCKHQRHHEDDVGVHRPPSSTCESAPTTPCLHTRPAQRQPSSRVRRRTPSVTV